jgi:hypothetical protein
MAASLRHVTVTPKGMGLNEFVAQQEGCFAAEGLGRGERFVYQPIPRQEFDEVLEQVTRWGLDQFLKDRSFDALRYSASR